MQWKESLALRTGVKEIADVSIDQLQILQATRAEHDEQVEGRGSGDRRLTDGGRWFAQQFQFRVRRALLRVDLKEKHRGRKEILFDQLADELLFNAVVPFAFVALELE